MSHLHTPGAVNNKGDFEFTGARFTLVRGRHVTLRRATARREGGGEGRGEEDVWMCVRLKALGEVIFRVSEEPINTPK